MNTISQILLGGLLLAVCACVWYLLTRKNSGCGCNCADCDTPCNKRRD